jgi:preprotein translocase subunit SecG
MVFIALLLILAVLLQSSKGGGLAGSLGGGQMSSTFGARRTADFLSKITWWLGGALIVLSVVFNLFFLPGQSTASQRESIIQSSKQNQIPSQPSLPVQQTPKENSENK